MKNKRYYQFLIIILFFGIVFQSCDRDDDFTNPEESLKLSTSTSAQSSKEINEKGARKLKNPYALKNMQKAWENIKKKMYDKTIKAKGIDAQRLEEGVIDYELTTTHYYVVLRPANVDQEAIIKKDPNMHVFDYPLDYEFTDEYLDNRTPGRFYTRILYLHCIRATTTLWSAARNYRRTVHTRRRSFF